MPWQPTQPHTQTHVDNRQIHREKEKHTQRDTNNRNQKVRRHYFLVFHDKRLANVFLNFNATKFVSGIKFWFVTTTINITDQRN